MLYVADSSKTTIRKHIAIYSYFTTFSTVDVANVIAVVLWISNYIRTKNLILLLEDFVHCRSYFS